MWRMLTCPRHQRGREWFSPQLVLVQFSFFVHPANANECLQKIAKIAVHQGVQIVVGKSVAGVILINQ